MFPPEQRTLSQLGEHYLLGLNAEFPDLAEALPAVRATAQKVVQMWTKRRNEAIKELRKEHLDNQAVSEAELSKWELRHLWVQRMTALFMSSLSKHPWLAIRNTLPSATFSKPQRILVETNKLLVMLFCTMWLQWMRGTACCVLQKEWLGCEGATEFSECPPNSGYTTCEQLNTATSDEGFTSDFYAEAEARGQHPEDFECHEFPSDHILMHTVYTVVLCLSISIPITVMLVTLFTVGGHKPTPKHWVKKPKKREDGVAAKTGAIWLLKNIVFVVLVMLGKTEMLGRILIRYFLYFTTLAERAGAKVGLFFSSMYAQTKKLRTSIWFLNEVVVKRRDPAAVLEILEVMEEKEKERTTAAVDAAATFQVARSSVDSFMQQMAYVLIALIWAATIWFLLTFSMIIRNMLGASAEITILTQWVQSVATDILCIHVVRAVFLHLLSEYVREKKIQMQSSDTALLEWYEDYVGKYLNTAYCRTLESMIGEELETMDPTS
ncbi:hypothetical protein CYMTET_32483 [Cymbomonas tetramitiformis]|uniref:Uncharacterized protein n=1 Tax=Cymbomonas tetramitiformis TaxID=36881 RepID=A0AAE0FEY4_9CHLO|nr:hypothetical protein CYMTET_32483 [Cymbomonas tetramitiformis]